MRRKCSALIVMCLLVCGWGFGEASNMLDFTGSVSGPDGKPAAGASVELYLFEMDFTLKGVQARSVGRTTADAEGKFAFSGEALDGSDQTAYCCLAEKKGLSCGWGTVTEARRGQFAITLTEPQKMIGFVQNPDGTPVSEAEVRLLLVAVPGGNEQFMFGIDPVDIFATRTCSAGRFEFGNLPEGATAEFLVKKPGKGTLHTFSPSVNPDAGLTYKASQTDIMLTMQDGFRLSGKVVTQDDQRPVKGVSVSAMDAQIPINLIHQPVESGEDGSFAFADLPPGDYRVGITDDSWIAEAKLVSVSADIEDTMLEVTKGGQAEIKVVDGATEEHVSRAQVNFRCEETGQYQHAVTDEAGTIKKQLLPGTYRVSVYAPGYRSVNEAGTLVVENKKTATLTVKLGGQTKITGLVQGPDGKSVNGAAIKIVPGSGASREGTTSDEKGQFKIGWDPEQNSWAEGEFYLIAFNEAANLAGVTLIGADTEEAVIKLQKGVEVQGKVLNAAGEPIPGARVSLSFRGSRYSSSFGKDTRTDAQGVYAFKALAPEQKYSVNISNAAGYGTGRCEIEPETSVTIENIVLQTADQKLSGQVVDVDGKGLANVTLHCYGEGQPNLNGKTDDEGKFAFDAVCSGEISISANYRQGTDYMYGHVRTEGGAEDVTIIVAQQGGNQRYVPKQPPSLIGKALPDLSACGVSAPGEAQSVLVYVWDMNQRPSRHFLKQLAAKADRLHEKKVAVVLLNAAPADKAALDAWLSDNGINWPCGIAADNPEATQFGIGAKALPWLILTNAENNVIAEGFSVEELEEKLNHI